MELPVLRSVRMATPQERSTYYTQIAWRHKRRDAFHPSPRTPPDEPRGGTKRAACLLCALAFNDERP